MALTLSDFEGTWWLDRRIDDRRAGEVLTLTGEARFVPAEGGLDYIETGTLTRPGVTPMQSRRVYRWRRSDTGIDVLFDDGRPFHSFDPTGQIAAATHWCAPDSYQVRYDFAAWPQWTSLWSVEGPRKAYEMQSRYGPA